MYSIKYGAIRCCILDKLPKVGFLTQCTAIEVMGKRIDQEEGQTSFHVTPAGIALPRKICHFFGFANLI